MKISARLALIALVALVAGGCEAESPGTDPAPVPSPSVDVEPTASPQSEAGCTAPAYRTLDSNRPRYRLHVDIDADEQRVTGDMRVEFTPDLATDRIVFRLWPSGPRDDGGAHLTMSGIRVDGRPVTTEQADPSTVIASVPVGADRTVTITAEWDLDLPSPVKDRISQDGDAINLGSFFPLLPWEPGRGWIVDPAIESLGEASISPTADFDVTVSGVPDDSVIASGTRVGPGRWRAEAVRDFALATGNFEYAETTARAPDPVRIMVGVHDGDGPPARTFAEHIKRAVEDLSERFGPYPWPTLNMAIVPNLGSAGIEYPTMIFQGEDSLTFATTHEVAHQWFYSLVGSNPARHPWMDESLATYTNAITDGTLDFFRDASIPSDARGQMGRPMYYWDRHPDSYFEGIYVQGVQALTALGDPDEVDCALKKYVAAHAFGIAVPRDLLDALEKELPGARDTLARFGI